MEFFKEFDQHGNRHSKRNLDILYRIMSKAEFENLACAAGFRVVEFFGDYSGTAFQEDASPSMIWVLEKEAVGD